MRKITAFFFESVGIKGLIILCIFFVIFLAFANFHIRKGTNAISNVFFANQVIERIERVLSNRKACSRYLGHGVLQRMGKDQEITLESILDQNGVPIVTRGQILRGRDDELFLISYIGYKWIEGIKSNSYEHRIKVKILFHHIGSTISFERQLNMIVTYDKVFKLIACHNSTED